jgi:hypothetical protein
VRVSISKTAATYYKDRRLFDSLDHALRFAASTSEYLLISETPHDYLILSGTLNAPRQLARTLVAHEIGELGLADWREKPNYEASAANAARLRNVIDRAKWES